MLGKCKAAVSSIIDTQIDLDEIQNSLGYKFQNPKKLRSAIFEKKESLIVAGRFNLLGLFAQCIKKERPKISDKKLENITTRLINYNSCYQYGLQLGLELAARNCTASANRWEIQEDISDATESIIGALADDGGEAAVQSLYKSKLKKVVKSILATKEFNWKDLLEKFISDFNIEINFSYVKKESKTCTCTISFSTNQTNYTFDGHGKSTHEAENLASEAAFLAIAPRELILAITRVRTDLIAKITIYDYCELTEVPCGHIWTVALKDGKIITDKVFSYEIHRVILLVDDWRIFVPEDTDRDHFDSWSFKKVKCRPLEELVDSLWPVDYPEYALDFTAYEEETLSLEEPGRCLVQ